MKYKRTLVLLASSPPLRREQTVRWLVELVLSAAAEHLADGTPHTITLTRRIDERDGQVVCVAEVEVA